MKFYEHLARFIHEWSWVQVFVSFIVAHWRQRAPASMSDNKRNKASPSSTV